MSELKSNINNIIKTYKKNGIIKTNRNDLMALILNMIVNYCGISQDKYHILSSYAIKDFKPVGDLDVSMNYGEFEKITKCKLGKRELYNGQIRYFIQLPQISADAEIEIFKKKPSEGFPNSDFSHSSLKSKLIRDNYGNLHYDLYTLIKWKNTVHREKDLNQLKLILSQIKKVRNTKSGMDILGRLGFTTSSSVDKLVKVLETVIKKW